MVLPERSLHAQQLRSTYLCICTVIFPYCTPILNCFFAQSQKWHILRPVMSCPPYSYQCTSPASPVLAPSALCHQPAEAGGQTVNNHCFFHPTSPHFVYHNLFMGGTVELVDGIKGERLVDGEASACPCIASRFPIGRGRSIGRQQRKHIKCKLGQIPTALPGPTWNGYGETCQ